MSRLKKKIVEQKVQAQGVLHAMAARALAERAKLKLRAMSTKVEEKRKDACLPPCPPQCDDPVLLPPLCPPLEIDCNV